MISTHLCHLCDKLSLIRSALQQSLTTWEYVDLCLKSMHTVALSRARQYWAILNNVTPTSRRSAVSSRETTCQADRVCQPDRIMFDNWKLIFIPRKSVQSVPVLDVVSLNCWEEWLSTCGSDARCLRSLHIDLMEERTINIRPLCHKPKKRLNSKTTHLTHI